MTASERSHTRPTLPFTLLALGVATTAWATGCAPEGGDTEMAARSDASPGDSAALYADRLMEALGGREAWEDTRYLAFRWIVERDTQVVADRAHAWDRYEGRYRLEFERDDDHHVAIFHTTEDSIRRDPTLGKVPAGRAWVNGEPLTGAAVDSALARAYGAFINDTYWLLMPLKWGDPGVHLAYEGRDTLSDGDEYAVVHLTFDEGLGVTEDQYWGYLEPETGMMAAWRYHLGRDTLPGPVIWWEDWERVGELRFAMDRRREGGGTRIYFEDVVASETVPEAAFAPPGS